MGLYLVTGVAGFIGAAVAKKLLNLGHRVVGIDNLSTGFLETVPEGVEFYEAGMHESSTINLIEHFRFDAIFHIAGQSGGELSYADPVYDLQSNAQSTLLLLKYASESGCKKIIYASTVSVYGDPKDPVQIDEESQTLPKSFYGVGKLASENYLRIYAEQFGLDTVALRLFNVYGPGQNLENFQQGITSIFLSQAIKYNHIHIKGSGERFRDIIHIDDVVDAFLVMLDAKYTGYRYYNVCTGKKTFVKDLVAEIQRNLPFAVTTEFSGSTPGDVFGYTGSCEKIMKETGWSYKKELHEGVKGMSEWALSLNK